MIKEDLHYYAPANTTATSAHGGRMSANRLISGVPQVTFPVVFEADRLALSVVRYKTFPKVNDDADGTLFAAKMFFLGQCGLEEYCKFWPATQTDTVASITGNERFYTSGVLDSNVSASGQTIVVSLKDADLTGGFLEDDVIVISNKATPDAVSGNLQYLTVDAAPTVVGAKVTLHVAEQLAYDFAAGAWISSVYEPGDIATSLSDTSHTGGADVDFDAIVLDNIGTVEQDFVATVTDSTHYTLVGDTLGAVGTGTVGTAFSPQNASFSKPLLTIPADFFAGLTLATGNIFSFSTHPANAPIWQEKTNPEDASGTGSNSITLWFTGQAAA